MNQLGNKDSLLFDLDNTLFDHHYSVKRALDAIKGHFGLSSHENGYLVDTYNSSLQEAYDKYLAKELTYEEKDQEKVKLFFANLKLEIPNPEEIQTFLELYENAYMEDRRATPGSVETLVRLGENRYKLAIVTNGQIDDQRNKICAIGLSDLVDYVIPSEEVGHAKPSPEIFNFALEKLQSDPKNTVMVGDDIKSDIAGSLNVNMDAILYSPVSKVDTIEVNNEVVLVIQKMRYLLKIFNINEPTYEASFAQFDNGLEIKGLGIDIVTAPRHCLNISKENVKIIANCIQKFYQALDDNETDLAINLIKEAMIIVASAANLIDEKNIVIDNGNDSSLQIEADNNPSSYVVTERRHSIAIEDFNYSIPTTNYSEDQLKEMTTLIQSFLTNLSIDYPRAGLRNLRDVIHLLDEKIIIKGEKIEE